MGERLYCNWLFVKHPATHHGDVLLNQLNSAVNEGGLSKPENQDVEVLKKDSKKISGIERSNHNTIVPKMTKGGVPQKIEKKRKEVYVYL